jgi:hypothetical protein
MNQDSIFEEIDSVVELSTKIIETKTVNSIFISKLQHVHLKCTFIDNFRA